MSHQRKVIQFMYMYMMVFLIVHDVHVRDSFPHHSPWLLSNMEQ